MKFLYSEDAWLNIYVKAFEKVGIDFGLVGVF